MLQDPGTEDYDELVASVAARATGDLGADGQGIKSLLVLQPAAISIQTNSFGNSVLEYQARACRSANA